MIFKAHTDTAMSVCLTCTKYFAKTSKERGSLLKKKLITFFLDYYASLTHNLKMALKSENECICYQRVY